MTLTLKGRVRGGRLVMDEPIELSEGTESSSSRLSMWTISTTTIERLHASIAHSAEQFRSGHGIPAEDVFPDSIVIPGTRSRRVQISHKIALQLGDVDERHDRTQMVSSGTFFGRNTPTPFKTETPTPLANWRKAPTLAHQCSSGTTCWLACQSASFRRRLPSCTNAWRAPAPR